MLKKILLCMLVLLAIGTGVALWLWQTTPMPQLTIKQVSLELLPDKVWKIDALCAIDNPLPFSLTCVAADYEIKADTALVAAGTVVLSEPVLARQQSPLSLGVKLERGKLKQLRSEQAGQPVTLLITGKLRLVAWGAQLQVPFHFTKVMTQQNRLFELTVKGVNIKQIKPELVDLVVKLGIASKLDLAIADLKASYDVTAKETKVADGALILKELPPHGDAIMEIPIVIQRAKFKAIKAGNLGKPIALVISGNLAVTWQGEAYQFPFTITKEIELQEQPFEVKVKKIRLRSLKNRTCLLVVEVKNKTSLQIQDLAIDGKITLGDGVEAELLNDKISLAPGQITQLTLELHSEKLGMVKLLKELIKQKRTTSKSKWKLRGKTNEDTVITSHSEEEDSVTVEE